MFSPKDRCSEPVQSIGKRCPTAGKGSPCSSSCTRWVRCAAPELHHARALQMKNRTHTTRKANRRIHNKGSSFKKQRHSPTEPSLNFPTLVKSLQPMCNTEILAKLHLHRRLGELPFLIAYGRERKLKLKKLHGYKKLQNQTCPHDDIAHFCCYAQQAVLPHQTPHSSCTLQHLTMKAALPRLQAYTSTLWPHLSKAQLVWMTTLCKACNSCNSA